jgi:D-alanyl-D-alanine carboxypeptidase
MTGPGRAAAAALLVLVWLAAGCSSSSGDRVSRDGQPETSASPSSGQASDAAPFPTPAEAGVSANLASALQDVIEDAVHDGVGTGVSASVVSATGRWAGVAGTSGAGEPLTKDASLSIASITKTFTAAEVMHLAETDLVDLDDKLSAYVELPVDDLGATVRDALAMRSGIPDAEPAPRSFLRSPDRHWSLDEVYQFVPNAPAQPSVAFQYSNTNYLLLGQLIGEVRGTTWAQAVREDLVDPVGSLRIALQDEEEASQPVAWPADQLRGTERYLPNRALASATLATGSIASDASSVALWGYLLYGGHVLRPQSLAQMLPERASRSYGFGTQSYKLSLGGLDAVGHDGEHLGFTSSLTVLRDQPLAAAVLISGDGRRPDVVADTLLTTVLESR